MTISAWPLDAVNGAPTYSGRVLRQTTNAPMLAGATAARPLGAFSGVRPGTSPATVTAPSSTSWACAPVAGVIDGQTAAEAGPYSFASDATVTGTITAANASNPRVDIVYVQISDPAESDGSAAPGVKIDYLAGTATAIPAAPNAPARSFVLARINVPKSGGGAPTVTWVAPYLAAAGARVQVATVALLPAVGTTNQIIDVYNDTPANIGKYMWTGTAWVQTETVGWVDTPASYSGFSGGTINYSKYRIADGELRYRFKWTYGSSGAIGNPTINFPVTPAPWWDAGGTVCGLCTFKQGSPKFAGYMYASGGSMAPQYTVNASSQLSTITNSNPIAWNPGHYFECDIRYPVV